MNLKFYEVMKYPIPKQKVYFLAVDNVYEVFKKNNFVKQLPQKIKKEKSYDNKILDEFIGFINRY
jgi:DNA-binding transcriptional regulator GbsR (MarR family)